MAAANAKPPRSGKMLLQPLWPSVSMAIYLTIAVQPRVAWLLAYVEATQIRQTDLAWRVAAEAPNVASPSRFSRIFVIRPRKINLGELSQRKLWRTEPSSRSGKTGRLIESWRPEGRGVRATLSTARLRITG